MHLVHLDRARAGNFGFVIIFFNHLLITFIVTRYTSEDISLITVHSTVNSITPLVTVELLTNSGAYKCQSTVGKLICMTV